MHMSGRKGKMKKGEYKEINSKVREKTKRSASENKREMYFKKEEMLMCWILLTGQKKNDDHEVSVTVDNIDTILISLSVVSAR